MCNGRLSVLSRNYNLENTIGVFLHRIRFSTPVIYEWLVASSPKKSATVRNTEITNKECLSCIRRPFSIGNVVLAIDIEPKLLRSLKLSAHKIGSKELQVLC